MALLESIPSREGGTILSIGTTERETFLECWCKMLFSTSFSTDLALESGDDRPAKLLSTVASPGEAQA